MSQCCGGTQIQTGGGMGHELWKMECIPLQIFTQIRPNLDMYVCSCSKQAKICLENSGWLNHHPFLSEIEQNFFVNKLDWRSNC